MNKIGSYRIIKRLGQSHEAETFQVWDDYNGRPLVLRKLLTDHYDDPDFCDELAGKLKRLLKHDSHFTAAFYKFEEIEGRICLLREFVDGCSLAELIAKEPYQGLAFYNVATQVTRGLGKAHEFGVIHGRLTPGNIIVSQRGYIKMTEFGLPLDPAYCLRPELIPPELKTGGDPNECSDLYSLGILFFQMLTGQSPEFSSQPMRPTVSQPSLPRGFSSATVKMIPNDIRLLIEKLISVDPADRGQNVDECLVTLGAILSSDCKPEAALRPEAGPPVSRWSGRTWLALSALSMLLIIFWLVISAVPHH